MRVTLDWDTEEEAQEYLPAINPDAARQAGFDVERTSLLDFDGTRSTGNPWELRQSSMGTGYHYVEWNAASDWGGATQLRDEYGDDPKRLRMDLMRRQRGSPFLQVLYSRKYMERWGWKPESGNAVETLAGVKHVPEPDRIKDESGRLDYAKIARVLASEEYGSQRALAESVGFARSTVGGWIRGEHRPSDAARKKLRRRARSRSIGHYVDDGKGGKSADELEEVDVEYFDADEKDHRRTIVEYISVPWADDESQLRGNVDDDDESTERLLNVHTGTWNDEHETGQLKYVHDQIEEHARDVLSPANHGNDLPQLDLDRINQITREDDSVNFEDELLDLDETQFYLDNMTDRVSKTERAEEIELRNFPLFEVILWAEDESAILWHVIGAWTGETVRDADVLAEKTPNKDYAASGGWW